MDWRIDDKYKRFLRLPNKYFKEKHRNNIGK